MNASNEHVYTDLCDTVSVKEVKARDKEFDWNLKFKQFPTGEEKSVPRSLSSYLHLSAHDSSTETWQSSMSYVSVDGTGTLSGISSGYLSVDENNDSENDDSCNGSNHCFSCLSDGIETEATHMCQTCRPEKKFICHKCLKQHNKFCDEHDVISLSVKCEQQTEPKGNSSDNMNFKQDFTYNCCDHAVPLEATSIHLHITDISKYLKDTMLESDKKAFDETFTMDHKKDKEHQQTISPKQSVVPSTDLTDELKYTLTPMSAKPKVLSTDSVSLLHFDKASQTDFCEEMKHSSVAMGAKHEASELFSTEFVRFPTSDKARNDYHQTVLSDFLDELKKKDLPLDEKPGYLSLFSTDNDSHKNKDDTSDIEVQGKAPYTVRNKNKINQCHLQKDRPCVRRKVKASFTDRNKNKRNQCYLQNVPELEKETPHTDAVPLSVLQFALKGGNKFVKLAKTLGLSIEGEIKSRNVNSQSESSAQTSSEPSVFYNNSLSGELVSIFGLNSNFIDEVFLEIINSSDSCDDISLFEESVTSQNEENAESTVDGDILENYITQHVLPQKKLYLPVVLHKPHESQKTAEVLSTSIS